MSILQSLYSEKNNELKVRERTGAITFEIDDTSSGQNIALKAEETNGGVSFNYQRNGESNTLKFLYQNEESFEDIDWGISFNIERERCDWV